MSPARQAKPLDEDGFPRVSGDEPSEIATVIAHVRFSPRERG